MTELIDIDLIVSDGNVRVGDSDVTTLAASIDRQGLIQPIVVTDKDGATVVVDGHRRLAACKRLGMNNVPVTRYDYVENAADRIVTQFQANEERQNLSAFEKAQATLELKEAGLTQADIAKELGISKGEVSKMQKVAKAVPAEAYETATLLTESGLTDITDNVEYDPEAAGLAIEAVVHGNAPTWQASDQATLVVNHRRFLEANEQLFEILAAADVDVEDEMSVGWADEWMPIAIWPPSPKEETGTAWRGRRWLDVGIDDHRAESCHRASMFHDYRSIGLVEWCSEPLLHAAKGESMLKDPTVTEASARKGTSPDKEAQKKERARKLAAKEAAVAWIRDDAPTSTSSDIQAYIEEAWPLLITNDLAQQFCKTMELEKVMTNGTYSAKETLVKHIRDKYQSPASRVAYASLFVHGYEYILPYNPRKKLGL